MGKKKKAFGWLTLGLLSTALTLAYFNSKYEENCTIIDNYNQREKNGFFPKQEEYLKTYQREFINEMLENRLYDILFENISPSSYSKIVSKNFLQEKYNDKHSDIEDLQKRFKEDFLKYPDRAIKDFYISIKDSNAAIVIKGLLEKGVGSPNDLLSDEYLTKNVSSGIGSRPLDHFNIIGATFAPHTKNEIDANSQIEAQEAATLWCINAFLISIDHETVGGIIPNEENYGFEKSIISLIIGDKLRIQGNFSNQHLGETNINTILIEAISSAAKAVQNENKNENKNENRLQALEKNNKIQEHTNNHSL